MSSGNWLDSRLSFLLDPLKEIQSTLLVLDTTHQDAVKDFQKTFSALTSGPKGFQGEGATAMMDLVNKYVAIENSVSGNVYNNSISIPHTGSGGPTISTIGSASAAMAVAVLDATPPVVAAAAAESTEVEVEVGLLVADAAQGGVDPITDGASIGLGIKIGIAMLGVVMTLIGIILASYLSWKSQLDILASTPLPSLPQKPEAPTTQIAHDQLNPTVPILHALTQTDQNDIDDLAKKYSNIDAEYIKELFEMGYSKDEVEKIIKALLKNKSSYKGKGADNYNNALKFGLAALLKHIADGMTSEEYQKLKDENYTDEQIRAILAANDQTLPEVLDATLKAKASGLYQQLQDQGLSESEINSMLGTMTKDEEGHSGQLNRLEAVLERLEAADKNGTDQNGMTKQQIHDLLFDKDHGIISALFSGEDSVKHEGKVATSIIEKVTGFEVKFGPGGSIGEIDIETSDYIIEVKKAGANVRADQIKELEANDIMNPEINGKRKKVFIYAPGFKGKQYDPDLFRSIRELREALGLMDLSLM
ncbi:hypothetical protein [Tengunoibacter tsumagoiensis]|uniref:Uncharacterized protein n=1 Tax=Tengunoibacter tsumagoiensis TaxID=2014871 RepID=A0A401ZUY6_9CHLR|nr:hypothetical protein [Tengunoibacter tsumagoiensis]GCE10534.1 hypothetical protein KTT_03930 [Tengunoibacter tsumagoiensis]